MSARHRRMVAQPIPAYKLAQDPNKPMTPHQMLSSFRQHMATQGANGMQAYTASPRASGTNAEMWLRLHEMKTRAGMIKEREAVEMRSPRAPPSVARAPVERPFPQPSLMLSPRRPGYGRPPPNANFPGYKKIVPRLMPDITLPDPRAAAPSPAASEVKPVEVKPVVVKRKWGELPPNVTTDDVRKAAGAIKEKLIDKFGALQKAFRAMDEDGSGTVDIKEFRRYLEIINLLAGLRSDVVDVLFEMLDNDQSGSIEFKEFARVMNSGDVMKMEAVAVQFDGYADEAAKSADAERKALEYQASLVGMTADEYKAYWDDIAEKPMHMQKSSDFAMKIK